VTLAANGAELAIDRRTGLIDHYSAGGRLLLQAGAPNFTRALTDNDIGTGVEHTHAVWKRASDGRRVERVESTRLPDGRAQVTVRYATDAAKFVTRYAMAGDGSVEVRADFEPIGADLPDPLRIGLSFRLPSTFDTVEWYGRGPHETYADRKTGAPIALWRGRIADQNHDYMRPQETGNKVDVRWLELSGAGGGLRVEGARPLSVNALAFPYADLDRRAPGTAKSSDIVAHGQVSLLVDAAQAGVGGDNQWDANGRPLAKYRIPVAPLSYSFTLRPFAGAGTTPERARPATATGIAEVVE